MKKLTSKQKAKVRTLAQNIKATFQIGTNEVHEGNLKAIDEGFNTQEILKIKVNREDIYDKEITGRVASELEKKLNCSVAGVIGTTIIIYRQNKNPEKRIAL